MNRGKFNPLKSCGFFAGLGVENGRGNRQQENIYFTTTFIFDFYFSRFPLHKPARNIIYIYNKNLIP